MIQITNENVRKKVWNLLLKISLNYEQTKGKM